MRSTTTKRFRDLLAALPADVQERAREAYRRFCEDPRRRGLRFKRVHATLPICSARISKNYRVVGQREGDLIVWYWIGSHAAYDEMLRT